MKNLFNVERPNSEKLIFTAFVNKTAKLDDGDNSVCDDQALLSFKDFLLSSKEWKKSKLGVLHKANGFVGVIF